MKSEQQELSPELFIADFIEKNKDELASNWLKIVRNQSLTRSYQAFDPEKTRARAKVVFTQLGRWLRGEFTKGDIESNFTALGAMRRREGFALAEVVRAITITRRVLWFKVLADGLLGRDFDARVGLELNNRVVLFFDRAIYYAAVGFERQ